MCSKSPWVTVYDPDSSKEKEGSGRERRERRERRRDGRERKKEKVREGDSSVTKVLAMQASFVAQNLN